jgi:hypothetical protein
MAKLSSDSQVHKFRDQKQPVLAKQGFRRFQGSPAHEVEMNLCQLDVPKSNTGGHAKRKSVGTELLSSSGNGMILPRCAGGIKFSTLFCELLR